MNEQTKNADRQSEALHYFVISLFNRRSAFFFFRGRLWSGKAGRGSAGRGRGRDAARLISLGGAQQGGAGLGLVRRGKGDDVANATNKLGSSPTGAAWHGPAGRGVVMRGLGSDGAINRTLGAWRQDARRCGVAAVYFPTRRGIGLLVTCFHGKEQSTCCLTAGLDLGLGTDGACSEFIRQSCVWHREERPGLAGPGRARHGRGRDASNEDRTNSAGLGRDRCGKSWQGQAGLGKAWGTMCHKTKQIHQARRGAARYGQAGPGAARRGKARATK